MLMCTYKDGLYNPSRRVHLRNRAACCVANPRRSIGYGCGLRLAYHPAPQRPLPFWVIQDILDKPATSRRQCHAFFALFYMRLKDDCNGKISRHNREKIRATSSIFAVTVFYGHIVLPEGVIARGPT